MKVFIYDKKRKKKVVAEIEKANKSDLINLDNSWIFDWKSIHSKKPLIFKLNYSDQVQGLLGMLQVVRCKQKENKSLI